MVLKLIANRLPSIIAQRSAMLATSFVLVMGCGASPDRSIQATAGSQAALYAVIEDTRNMHAVPDDVRATFSQTLEARGLTVGAAPEASLLKQFRSEPDSVGRARLAMAQTRGASVGVGLDIQARYYSQINGQNRWTVQSKIALVDSAGDTFTRSSTHPVFLKHAHEGAAEATREAAARIARDLDRALEQFLARRKDGNAEPSAAESPTGTDIQPQETGEDKDDVDALDPELEVDPENGTLPPEASMRGPLYFILVDRFFDGETNVGAVDRSDPQAFHGGDLAGIKKNSLTLSD